MKRYPDGAYLLDGTTLAGREEAERHPAWLASPEQERKAAHRGTISYRILKAHNHSGSMERLSLRFDALVAQDMTYMGVLQTAIASGVERFPVPFVLSNCHNSLCALGGTANEDDHRFAQGAVRKYGGIMLPTHQAVMHQYMRECFAGGGKMILGADSHTRYGALGTLATGEGGGELVKQLLGKTYDIPRPETVLLYLHGSLAPGVGPQDVMLAVIREVFPDGFVKNRIMEFCGPGVHGLSVDCRNGIDVMATESAGMFTIWETDEAVREWLCIHGRGEEYRLLRPEPLAYYDRALDVDLSAIRPMIALPFHPSNAYSIEELSQNLEDILAQTEEVCNRQMAEFGLKLDLRGKIEKGKLRVDQGVIAGCAGGLFENLSKAADLLRGRAIGNHGYHLNVYPASQPVLYEVMRQGIGTTLLEAGANLRTAFCGPCFGAGDVPFDGGLSVRHTTRNFSSREGSQPGKRQLAAVALMDSLSIAATSASGGILTPATDFDGGFTGRAYTFHRELYRGRVLDCFGRADPAAEPVKGPGIGDIPPIPALGDHLLLCFAAVIIDPVTTTDELIPNGESSSYRSNFERIAEYTLSAKVPEYVGRCKKIREWHRERELGRDPGRDPGSERLSAAVSALRGAGVWAGGEVSIGSALYAISPGDGSAREYAASNQKVLGGWANLCRQYATKRYRSNLINWGVLPFTFDGEPPFAVGDFLWLPGIRALLESGEETAAAYWVHGGQAEPLELQTGPLDAKEREILLEGCLINVYRREAEAKREEKGASL